MREAGKCTHRGIVIKETNGQSGVGKLFLFLGPRMVGTELKIFYKVKLFTEETIITFSSNSVNFIRIVKI